MLFFPQQISTFPAKKLIIILCYLPTIFRDDETIDTRSLDSEPKTPEEVMALFGMEILNVTSPELSGELRHLESVLGLVVATAIAKDRPELAHVLPLLLSSTHHSHSQSYLPLEEANLTLVSPHYTKVGF